MFSVAFVEFTSPQAAAAVKAKVEAGSNQPTYMGKRHSVSYTNPNTNPFRTLPKDAPQRDRPREFAGGRGSNDRVGGHAPGPIGSVASGPMGGPPPVGGMAMGSGFRGGRGGFNNPRGGMGAPFMAGRGNFTGPVSQGSPQPGFQTPMGGNFGGPNMPMQQFGAGGFQAGNFQGRGGMGMRGGPNMRGRGMGPNPMMPGAMGGMGAAMGMGGNMGGMPGAMSGMGGQNMEGGGFNPMGNMSGFGMGGMGMFNILLYRIQI